MSIIEKAVGKIDRRKKAPQKESGAVVASAGNTALGRDFPEPELPPKEVPVAVPAAAGAGGDGSSTPANTVILPFEELHEQGIVVPTVPRSTAAESFRTIKRPLLENVFKGESKLANLIMVTSALQGEGKTFTSISLAMSIAMEQDKRVLFVDADIARASAGRMLGLAPDALGLIDVLERQDVSMSDAILRTNVEKLSILPAGAFHERCNELLASGAMRALMEEMSKRYPDRIVVFDSPPVLLTTEASVLANHMGQLVFVVQADRTPQHVVNEALERISEEKLIGMVLNQAKARRLNGMGYGYGYLYGYGYGYGYGGRGRRKASSAPEQVAEP